MDRYIVQRAVTSKATTHKQQETKHKQNKQNRKPPRNHKNKKPTAQGESVIGWQAVGERPFRKVP